MTSKVIHFTPILSVCLRKNFQYKFCISRENRGTSFVNIHMGFITYVDFSHSYDFLCVFHELLMRLKNINIIKIIYVHVVEDSL